MVLQDNRSKADKCLNDDIAKSRAHAQITYPIAVGYRLGLCDRRDMELAARG